VLKMSRLADCENMVKWLALEVYTNLHNWQMHTGEEEKGGRIQQGGL
jgi:hypothetical protein